MSESQLPQPQLDDGENDIENEMTVLSDIIIDTFLEKKRRKREHPPPENPE